MLKVLYNSCGNGPGYVPASEDGASSKLQGESWLKLAAYLAGVRLQCFSPGGRAVGMGRRALGRIQVD